MQAIGAEKHESFSNPVKAILVAELMAASGPYANFPQFFAVRQNPRQCGHVSISDHFRQWQGSINFTTSRVTATVE